MTGRVALGRRNLLHERRRALLSVGGVAVSFTLVFLVQGIFAGAMRQVTAYIRSSPADVFVSQLDVKTMHMSASALEPGVAGTVARVDGVAWAEPLYYTTGDIESGDHRQISYVFGYETELGRAGPQHMVEGRAPDRGEAVVDEVTADEFGLAVGGRLTILGRPYRISGLASGGTNIVNTTVYVTAEDFVAARGPAVAFVLAGAVPGTSAEELRGRLAAAFPQATVQTRSQFAVSERQVVSDMSTDILRLMTAAALLIGLAVIALTLLALTLSKLREYGVVRALGGRTRMLAGAVVAQAAWLVALGLGLAVGLTLGLGAALGALTPNIRVVVEPGAVVRVALAAAMVAAIGAAIPLRPVVVVDPASVFRRA